MISSLLMILVQPQELPPCNQEKADQGIQQEMNICAANEYYEADAELNAVWALARERMMERDAALEDYPLPEWDDRPGYFESLLESQRAWLTYRDAFCRTEGYAARGGSLEPLLAVTCKTALTRKRTQELQELLEYPQ